MTRSSNPCHCEERSDAAISSSPLPALGDCRASLAMTVGWARNDGVSLINQKFPMPIKNIRQTGVGGALQALLAWAILLGLLSAVAGCGFHPRGSSALPSAMAVTWIKSGQPYGTLVDDFSEALRAHGGVVTRERSEATAILHIISNEVEKRVLSVNTAGKVLEFETRQTIRFSVMTSENLSLVEVQEVSMARDYLFSSTDILGKEREDRVVRQALQHDLVNLAMLRITAVAR